MKLQLVKSAKSFLVSKMQPTDKSYDFKYDILSKYYKSDYTRSDDSENTIITVILKNANGPSSSSFIRLISPLVRLNKYKIEIIDGNDFDDVNIKSAICIVQRIALKSQGDAKKLTRILRSNKIPLFTDTDDAFCNVDVTHPEYEDIKERSDALTYLIENADINMFSTHLLAKIYNKLANRSDGIVIENTLDEHLWSRWYNHNLTTSVRSPLQILYMGTPTHDADFSLVEEVLEEIHLKSPGSFEMSVIGVSRHLQSREWMNILQTEDILYPGFVNWFSQQGPFDIGVAPLLDSDFNNNKSDIKCLDYIAIGAHPIVSDVTAYNNLDLNSLITRVENSRDDWYYAIMSAINEKQQIRDNTEAKERGYKYLSSKRSSTVAMNRLHKLFAIYINADRSHE